MPAWGRDLLHADAIVREAILNILGTTGIIVPMGTAQHEAANRTTVTSVGENQFVFTYSEAVTAFDTVPVLTGPGNTPIITFNGTDEELDTPDVTYFSPGSGAADTAFSVGMWIRPGNVTGEHDLFSKGQGSSCGAGGEWVLLTQGATIQLGIRDNSAGVAPNRVTGAAAIALSTWAFVVATYDGGGGATAANGINFYVDGVVNNGSASNNAAYVAMEDLIQVVSIAKGSAGGNLYAGKIAGGAIGPFYTQAQLSADAVKRLYQLGRTAIDV